MEDSSPGAPKRIDSLSSLLEIHAEGAKAGRPEPEPITLAWTQWGTLVDLVIETKWSDKDHWSLGIDFMAATYASQTPSYDDAGKETYPNVDAPLLLLLREFTSKPTWLKNPDALKRLRQVVPPEILGTLKMELMLHAGFNNRFFVNYQRFLGQDSAMQDSASPNASESTQTPLNQPPPSASSSLTNTISSAAEKTASNTSPTTYGSSSPTPPTKSSAAAEEASPTPSSVIY